MIRFDLRRLAALVRKETWQILRDPSTFLIAFVLPMILLFLFGYAVSLDTAKTRVGVVLEDSSAPALRLAQAYQSSRWFEVTMARTVAEVRDRMTDGQLRAIIVIPQDFGEGVKRGKVPPIQIIADGSQPNTANFAAAYGEGIRANWAASEGLQKNPGAAGAPVIVSARYWYNPELKSRYFLVPGSIANVMTMVGTLLTALVIAREWERGTMEAIMATPISMVEFIASKVIPYFLLAQCSMALCAVIGIWVFGVPFRGSIFALLAISSAFLMPALGLGLFISAATKNQFVASQAALLSAFLPTFLLSGFIYEIGSMPWPIQALTYIVPARYLIPSLETVFLVGDQWGLILPNIGIMLLFGMVFFTLSFRVTRRSLD
ncbi:ABC transporter permease [Sphingomonas sp. R-74633]|uniref:ABC transporter permease n=1 Tax=Sphingomonas sp. R-74633 TaxID=2751188 RepID=UPI0015D2FF58|nr:ABC transporter permease [Sphingomonas sp. R-74633]NYT41495.1 ABC transporter permease [Sphingomonas sp. R-74633]